MSSPLYKTARWRKLRAQQLIEEPLCRYCDQAGKVTPATVADHVIPHRGDEAKFWGGELQSLCAACHSSAKQREEITGKVIGCDADGWPLDPDHHWKR
jgi:5-methylcytosine-specific restriction endonuclease McrA